MFKFIDNTGEILVLRPDVTIPIAKVAAKTYSPKDKHLKLSYTSRVFRMANTQNPTQREFIQGGIEYFGNKEIECDGEVAVLAIDTLLRNHVDIHMEIGHVEFYKGLLEETNLEASQQEDLRRQIENKNIIDLRNIVKELNVSEPVKEAFLEIPNLYGKFEDILPKARIYCINNTMVKALDDLEEMYALIKDYGYSENISMDLGLVNHLDYYTGIIYKGYISNHGKTIVSGGRYDNLTGEYGQFIPACGFAINIDELIKGVDKMETCKQERSYIDYLILYTNHDRQRALNIGQELRGLGYIIETEPIESTLGNSIQHAELHGIKEILTLKEDKLKIISIQKNTTKKIPLDEFLNEIGTAKDKEMLSIH